MYLFSFFSFPSFEQHFVHSEKFLIVFIKASLVLHSEIYKFCRKNVRLLSFHDPSNKVLPNKNFQWTSQFSAFKQKKHQTIYRQKWVTFVAIAMYKTLAQLPSLFITCSAKTLNLNGLLNRKFLHHPPWCTCGPSKTRSLWSFRTARVLFWCFRNWLGGSRSPKTSRVTCRFLW